MKTRSLNFILLIVLLAGCTPAVKSVANQADDVGRLFGDDIARFVTKYGDDVARTSQQYADDIGRQAQYSDKALRYWDDVIRSSQSVDEAASLLYRSDNLSPLQDDFVRWFRAEANRSEDEALLYLQSVCSVANYVQFYNEYPSKSSTQLYVEQVAEKNGILIFSAAEFAEAAISSTAALVEGDGSYSQQEGAYLLFQGLCLVSDVMGN